MYRITIELWCKHLFSFPRYNTLNIKLLLFRKLIYVCVFVRVCVHARLLITSSVMWHDTDSYNWLSKFCDFYNGSCSQYHYSRCGLHTYYNDSHWLGWSGVNLTTFMQFIQLRFNKLISSVVLQTSFVKNTTLF